MHRSTNRSSWSKSLILSLTVLSGVACRTVAPESSEASSMAPREEDKPFACTSASLSLLKENNRYAGYGIAMLPYCLALDSAGLVSDVVRAPLTAIDWLRGRSPGQIKRNISVEMRDRLPEVTELLAGREANSHQVTAAVLAVTAYDSKDIKDAIVLKDGKKLTRGDIRRAWGEDSDETDAFDATIAAAESMRELRGMSRQEVLARTIDLLLGDRSTIGTVADEANREAIARTPYLLMITSRFLVDGAGI
jgi:hypothetical protein